MERYANAVTGPIQGNDTIMKRPQPIRLSQLGWGWMLIIALMFTQFAGQKHRIDHTRWLEDSSAQVRLAAATPSTLDINHSCIFYDAATMADGVASLPYAAPLLNGTALTQATALSASWSAAAVRYFCARAPPTHA